MQKNEHGGRRARAGRKTEVLGEKMEKTTVLLNPMAKRKLMVLGEGNLSKGIRRAAEVAFDRYQQSAN